MDESGIYLNNAATSWPKPREVIDAVADSLTHPLSEFARSTDGLTRDVISDARSAAAGFFHVPDPDHIVFTANATDSLNILIAGFAQQEQTPCHVIITELDHNSVIRPIRAMEASGKCRVTVIPCMEGRVNPAEVSDAICPDTRLMVMTHGSNVLGSVQDLPAIGRILHEREVFFLVDGAQTAGLVPVQPERLPLDAFVFTGHKYLFGLPGTGGFWIRDPDRIATTRHGGTGTNSRSSVHPQELPEKFEAGTHNYPGIISLRAGIEFIERQSQEEVLKGSMDRTGIFLRTFRDIEDLVLYNQSPDLPLIPFNFRNIGNDDAGFILRKMYGIIARTGLHCAPLVHERFTGGAGCVRLSPSYLTSREDCVLAAESIREVAERAHRS